MKRSFFRGHPIVWSGSEENGKWVYDDTGENLPSTGGKTRPCKKCGAKYPLGEREKDPCLGYLPGVDNACCGHGERSKAFVRFINGVVLKGFEIEEKT